MSNSNTRNHLTMCKQMSSGSLENVTYKLFTYKSYVCIKYSYKQEIIPLLFLYKDDFWH